MRVVSHYEHRTGFRAIVRVPEGQLHFARYVIDGPICETRDEAAHWAANIIEENALRNGPFAIAVIEPYSGPISMMKIAD
jgi:hypothetical protein